MIYFLQTDLYTWKVVEDLEGEPRQTVGRIVNTSEDAELDAAGEYLVTYRAFPGQNMGGGDDKRGKGKRTVTARGTLDQMQARFFRRHGISTR